MIRFLAVLMVVAPQAVSAESLPSAGAIADTLAAPSPPLTKSFTPAAPAGSKGMTHVAARPDAPAAIDLDINFEFDSAELTPDGALLVGNLGRALKDSRLAGRRFRIEGHTDAKGGDGYNQALSERRARAVSRALVARHGADGGRLEVVGLGESRLLDAANPESGVNRRVRVINLGDAQ